MQNAPTLRIESPRLLMAIQNPISPHRQKIDGWDVSETYLQESAEGAPSGVGSYRIIFEAHPTTSDEALKLYEAGVELAELLEKLWLYVATTPLSGPRFMLVLVPLAPPKSWVTNYEDVYRNLTARESGIHFGHFEICPRFWSYPLDFPLRDILTVREKYLTADEATKTLIDLHFNAHLASGLHAKEVALARALELFAVLLPAHSDAEKEAQLPADVRNALTRRLSWLYELSNRRFNTRHVVSRQNKPALLPPMTRDEHVAFVENADVLLRGILSYRLGVQFVVAAKGAPSPTA